MKRCTTNLSIKFTHHKQLLELQISKEFIFMFDDLLVKYQLICAQENFKPFNPSSKCKSAKQLVPVITYYLSLLRYEVCQINNSRSATALELLYLDKPGALQRLLKEISYLLQNVELDFFGEQRKVNAINKFFPAAKYLIIFEENRERILKISNKRTLTGIIFQLFNIKFQIGLQEVKNHFTFLQTAQTHQSITADNDTVSYQSTGLSCEFQQPSFQKFQSMKQPERDNSMTLSSKDFMIQFGYRQSAQLKNDLELNKQKSQADISPFAHQIHSEFLRKKETNWKDIDKMWKLVQQLNLNEIFLNKNEEPTFLKQMFKEELEHSDISLLDEKVQDVLLWEFKFVTTLDYLFFNQHKKLPKQTLQRIVTFIFFVLESLQKVTVQNIQSAAFQFQKVDQLLNNLLPLANSDARQWFFKKQNNKEFEVLTKKRWEQIQFLTQMMFKVIRLEFETKQVISMQLEEINILETAVAYYDCLNFLQNESLDQFYSCDWLIEGYFNIFVSQFAQDLRRTSDRENSLYSQSNTHLMNEIQLMYNYHKYKGLLNSNKSKKSHETAQKLGELTLPALYSQNFYEKALEILNNQALSLFKDKKFDGVETNLKQMKSLMQKMETFDKFIQVNYWLISFNGVLCDELQEVEKAKLNESIDNHDKFQQIVELELTKPRKFIFRLPKDQFDSIEDVENYLQFVTAQNDSGLFNIEQVMPYTPYWIELYDLPKVEQKYNFNNNPNFFSQNYVKHFFVCRKVDEMPSEQMRDQRNPDCKEFNVYEVQYEFPHYSNFQPVQGHKKVVIGSVQAKLRKVKHVCNQVNQYMKNENESQRFQSLFWVVYGEVKPEWVPKHDIRINFKKTVEKYFNEVDQEETYCTKFYQELIFSLQELLDQLMTCYYSCPNQNSFIKQQLWTILNSWQQSLDSIVF